MRKLLGGLATWTAPVVVLAFTTGCTRSHRESPGSASADETPGRSQTQRAALGEEKAQLNDLLEQCGFECNTLAEGNASISGNGKIDGFFSAVLSLKGATAQLEGEVEATLGEMAALVGAQVGANVSVTADNIAAKLKGGLDGNIQGGVTIRYVPPKCSVSAKASVEAAAKCDAKVDPGSVEVECKGECEASADVQASCSGDATLECRGTAPSFECEGTCEGTCELNANAKCEGTCRVQSEADCEGEFTADSGGSEGAGTCAVRANGQCKGTCELSAGAKCDGQCKGECTYTPPSGGCDAQATATCKAKANASVMCKGECKGEATPPMVSADCQATAKAEAQFNAECTPPAVKLDYQLAAKLQGEANADARLAFEAKLEAFGKAFASLAAKGARIEGIITASAALPQAGFDAVSGIASDLANNSDLKVKFKAGCAVTELGTVKKIVGDATAELNASLTAIGKVTTAVKAS